MGMDRWGRGGIAREETGVVRSGSGRERTGEMRPCRRRVTTKTPQCAASGRGETERRRELLFLSGQAGLLQGVEDILVVEITGHFKRLGAFGGRVAGDPGHTRQNLVDRLDTFATA